MTKRSLKSIGITIFLLFSFTLILSYSCAAVVKTTIDPTLVGMGARPIGTGKAFVGLSDDVNAIFMNPAGLAGQKTWQVQSMSTELLNVIRYISFAGTYNTDYGTLGLGYVGGALGGSIITTLDAGGIIIPVSPSDSIDFTSSVILLSYGSEAKRFLSYDWLKNVSVGATLKVFSQGLSNVEGGLMTGYNMDLGFLYKHNPWLSFGWNQVDVLPASMGAKLIGSSGSANELPTTTKLGMAVKVLGENSLYGYSQPLTFLLDLDYMPSRTNYPTLLRSGIEWLPIPYLALRVGFDQDVIGSDTSLAYNVDTNLCAGVGLQYNGFKIDYAYHKYGALSDNDTNYISLSYSPPFEVPVPHKEKFYLKIYSPADKTITYDAVAVIIGKVFNLPYVSKLTINDVKVNYSEDGTFEAAFPLVIGKNSFVAKVLDSDDKVLDSARIRILRLIKFTDVPDNFWGKKPIEQLATLKIIGGYADDTFKPNKTISRAELMTLLIRSKTGASPQAVETMFKDVTSKHWASFFVKTGVETGLTKGYPDKTFKPSKPVTRAEGVAIFTRFSDLKLPEILFKGPYPDVPGRHWAAKNISAARSAGMLTYLGDKPFGPEKGLSRVEAAEILSKTPFGKQKVNDLYDFDTY